MGDEGGSLITCCVGSCLLTIIIVVALSFQYVEHDQIALKKNQHSNTVKLEDGAYGPGRYMWGPSYEVLTFPKTWQKVEFAGDTRLSVGNRQGVAVEMDISFQWRIRPELFPELYRTKGVTFEQLMVSQALATIKNTAVLFNVTSFFEERAVITAAFGTATEELLADSFPALEVPADMFLLGQVTLASQLMESRLQIAVQHEVNLKKEFELREAEELARTQNMVAEFSARSTLAVRTATANRTRDIAIARSRQSEALVQTKANGLAGLMTGLEIDSETDAELAEDFLKLMALLDNEDAHIVNTDRDTQIHIEVSG